MSKAPVVSLSKKLCPYCLSLVGSRNDVFERDFTIVLKLIEGLMEDWLKYRQNQKRVKWF